MRAVVYFFGGYLSTLAEVEAWQRSAASQRPDLTFHIQPWPGGPSGDPLTNWHTGSQRIAQIIADNKSTEFYLVGHSSGCGIANDVARVANDLGAENFNLIVLDGFRPSPALLGAIGERTQCWSAEWYDAAVGKENYSLNYSLLKETPHFNIWRPQERATGWALHFSLINLKSNDATVESIDDGYADCVANLCWLPK